MMTTTEEVVEYRDGEAELSGFLVCHEQGGRRPGILVVHGGAGLDDHARGRARKFAELGLVAFACDMYGKSVLGDRDRVISCLMELRDDRRKMTQRASAAIDILAADPRVDGRLAAVGYCFGGLAVLELARSGANLSAVISVHGSLATTGPRAGPDEIKAKLLVCHGALDPHVPTAQLTPFIEEMNGADADWQLIVYGGAMHGFTHEGGPAAPGVAYHAASDVRSSTAISAFLAEALGWKPAVGQAGQLGRL
jgi:dienelactone hydrolase